MATKNIRPRFWRWLKSNPLLLEQLGKELGKPLEQDLMKLVLLNQSQIPVRWISKFQTTWSEIEQQHTKLAIELGETCAYMYSSSPTVLAPDKILFPSNNPSAHKWI